MSKPRNKSGEDRWAVYRDAIPEWDRFLANTYAPKCGHGKMPNMSGVNQDLAVIARAEANRMRKAAFRRINAHVVLYPASREARLYRGAMETFTDRGFYFTPSWTPEAREGFYGIKRPEVVR